MKLQSTSNTQQNPLRYIQLSKPNTLTKTPPNKKKTKIQNTHNTLLIKKTSTTKILPHARIQTTPKPHTEPPIFKKKI